jgi:hypothetical protein
LLIQALVMGSLAVDTDLGGTIIALGCPVVIVGADIKDSECKPKESIKSPQVTVVLPS